MQEIIRIDHAVVRHPDYRFKNEINLVMNAGEQIAIVGGNGSGKTLLVDVLTGKHALLRVEPVYDFRPSPLKHAYENIKYMEFRDTYGESDATYYYQKRWNQHDLDDSPLVGDLLQETLRMNAPEVQEKAREFLDQMLHQFGLSTLLDKHVVTLSSGELRKFQLAKALLTLPRVLIIDNPFIGLDAGTRDSLRELLEKLATSLSILFILVLSRKEDIPDFVTHVIPVENRTVLPKVTRQEYLAGFREEDGNVAGLELLDQYLNKIEDISWEPEENKTVLDFKDVSIRYGARTILKDVNWTVKQGQRWSLSGENGSGKSTLLSIVCADNPQSYACNVSIFGNRRGTGESIWDIKKHIGYVSPEMHRAYMRDLPAIDIVASGLHDSIGLYVRPKPEQRAQCELWMNIFGIGKYKDQTFLKLSSGEQRLVLLARAFVKNPDLLILDEPLHGLDSPHKEAVKKIISTFARQKGKTLIMVTHYQEELPDCFTQHLYLKRNN